jgi:DNA-binding transcriptional regulator YiaG
MNGKQVKKLRKRLRWRQLDLAHYLDVAMSTIYLWESERTQPEGPAAKLLHALDKGIVIGDEKVSV